MADRGVYSKWPTKEEKRRTHKQLEAEQWSTATGTRGLELENGVELPTGFWIERGARIEEPVKKGPMDEGEPHGSSCVAA